MNYIKEINAFHVRRTTEPLTIAGAMLWFVLMDVNNQTAWKKKFTVAASLLAARASMSPSTFKRARKELFEKGYIHYKSQGANRAAVYQMVSLANGDAKANGAGEDGGDDAGGGVLHVSDADSPTVTSSHGLTYEERQEIPRNDDVNLTGGMDHSSTCTDEGKQMVDCSNDHNIDQGHARTLDHTADPLVKGNQTIQNETNSAAAAAICFYMENFMETEQGNPNDTMKPYMVTELETWVERMGEELVLTAMKRSFDRGFGTWSYALGILADWKAKGVQTIDDVRADDQVFKQQQAKRGNRVARRSSEVIPDWFKERGQPIRGQNQADATHVEIKDADQERAELEALLG